MDGTDLTNDLIGRKVLDAAGGHLGPLVALYADADTGTVTFGDVTVSRRGRRRSVLVPVEGARVTATTVTLRCGGALVRRAPTTHAGRLLAADDEPRLFAHYDIPYAPATSADRRILLVQD